MQLDHLLYGGQEQVRDVVVRHGATAIAKGAVVMKGATPGTNNGMAIVGSGSAVDVIGVLLESVATTETDSDISGDTQILKKCVISPDAVYLVEYDQADTIAGTSSTTTFTLGSLEDDIDGGWIFVVTGDPTSTAGDLRHIVASTAGSCTTSSSFSTDLAGGTQIKILPVWHQLLKLNTAATKIGSDAGAGSGRFTILENYFQADGIPFQRLDPVKWQNTNDLTNAKFYAKIIANNHVLAPFD